MSPTTPKRTRRARKEPRMQTDTETAPPSTIPTSEWITERQLAQWVGVSCVTLQQMRWKGNGPPFTKFGTRAIRYHVPSVRAWLDARTVSASAR